MSFNSFPDKQLIAELSAKMLLEMEELGNAHFAGGAGPVGMHISRAPPSRPTHLVFPNLLEAGGVEGGVH